MDQLITKLLDELRGSWRFRWIGFWVACGVCGLGWIGVLTMPNVYEASARVYVDTQSALRPLLQGLAVAPNVESSLAIVRQALLSRPQLEKVARDNDLDVGATSAKERELLIDSLKERIVITADGNAPGGAASTDGVYRIRFQENDRTKSLAVVQGLLNAFVDDTLGSKRSGQEVAQKFLREQIAEYERRLADAEQRLADFKKKNVGKMPDQRGDYFARLQAESVTLEDLRKQLSLAAARRDELTRQLDGEDPFVFGFETDIASANSGAAGDITLRIQDLEKKEQELLVRFTDKHPEIVGIRRQLDELRQRQAEEIARLKQGRGTGSLAQSTKANPVFQSMKIELNRAEVQVAEIQRSVAQQAGTVSELRRLIDTVPQVEADVARLNRDYEVTRAQYLQLVQRLETAKISENADETGTVKFEVIDPPSVPLKPESPNRPLLLATVLVLGFGAGAAITYLMNMLRPVFHNRRALAEATGLDVIGSVSRTWVEDARAARRSDVVKFSAGLAGLVVAFVLLLLVQGMGADLLSRITG